MPNESLTPALRTQGLRKSFGSTEALRGLDLEVRRGEVFGLLGPNGAGKSTTVKILVTLTSPGGGLAEVLGLDVTREPDQVRARIGYVPQDLTMDRDMTGRENLLFFARLYGLDRIATRVDEALREVGLADSADRRARTYSGGMKKRLDIACGLMHEPEVLFLDEPSLGLDVPGRREVWDRIEAFQRRGRTVLLCTNYMDEAERLCDRVGIIDDGRLHVVGTPRDLKAELGGDVLVLSCNGETSALRERLAAEPCVARVLELGKDQDRALHVYVSDGETAVPQVLDAARACGTGVSRLVFHRPGLDEVFLRHTGHELAGGPPS